MKRLLSIFFIVMIMFVGCNKSKVADIPDNAVLIKKLSGTLEVMGAKLPLVLNVYQSPEGNLIGSVDSPAQGAYGIAVEKVTISDTNIVFNVTSIGGKYEGKQTGPDQYEGDWTQGGKSFLLKIAPLKRPQEPKDFPYKVEDVVFTNSKADIKLAGTLTTPKSDGPFPAVVLISGSGPQNRNEELMSHKPFLILSDHFTRNGIAVLRYDDRGTAESEGDFSTATSFDFADDAAAAVAFLKSHPGFFSIGLAGHSEGGVIAPIVANQSEDVDFIILMAGSGLTGKEILELQGQLILQQTEITLEGLEVYKKTQSAMLQIVVDIENNEEALKKLLVVSEVYRDLSQQDQQIIGYNPETFEAALKALLSPWMRTFLTLDPRSVLEKMTIPVLAINGEKDLQVPAKENLSEIKAALERGGNTNHEIHELKNLNHLFQTCETGAIGEYGIIEETFNEEAMDLMTQWILEKTVN